MQPISEADVKKYPHSSVLSLECLFKDGTNKFGTGFLSGNNFALTSAHVVFDGELGLATHIKCHISRHGSNKLKTVLVSHYVYPKSYESTYRKIVSQEG